MTKSGRCARFVVWIEEQTAVLGEGVAPSKFSPLISGAYPLGPSVGLVQTLYGVQEADLTAFAYC